MWSKVVILVSSIGLLYSAYLAWIARSEVLSSGLGPTLTLGSPVPLSVLVPALGSFALLHVGILASAPRLKGVTWASEMSHRTIDQELSHASFATVRHRGAILFKE